jgi:acetoin utilization deacetylase AcuC-like enzyme
MKGADRKMNTCYLYDDIYLKHITGDFHPERPERLTAINEKIETANWFTKINKLRSQKTNVETIQFVHHENYIKRVKEECETGWATLSTGDTTICEDSYVIALAAVGGILDAVEKVMKNEAKYAFCAVRPPGHHATPSRGMGFCIFNNIAIAARYAQKKYGVERILIVDWDVHHGNGTQDTFYSDSSVFFMSTHQWPLYPGTGRFEEIGEGKGKGLTMNRPFSPGAGNEEIIGAFKNDLLPAAKDFKPDLTLISAGFDSHEKDPLGGFEVNDMGFRELTKIMLEISHINGDGRLVSILEGGYNLEGLSNAVYAHMDELVLNV